MKHQKNPAAQVVIHPRVNAVLSGKDEWTQRDWHVHKIRSDGVEAWRRESGYYRQSTVENTFYRYKTIIGKRLRARGEDACQVEATIACKILNRFLDLGRTESIPVVSHVDQHFRKFFDLTVVAHLRSFVL